MSKSISILLLNAFGFFLFSCSQKMDSPQLIEVLQNQVDHIITEGNHIDRIDVCGKMFADYGPEEVGYFSLMFIRAVPFSPRIESYANYNYNGDTESLNFLGYSSEPKFDSRKTYNYKPDLTKALSRLDEIKTLIPERYSYANLLYLRYDTTDDRESYEFMVEVTPEAEGISHPNVKQYEESYVSSKPVRSFLGFGGTKNKDNTETQKKIQHTVMFRLWGDRIEME